MIHTSYPALLLLDLGSIQDYVGVDVVIVITADHFGDNAMTCIHDDLILSDDEGERQNTNTNEKDTITKNSAFVPRSLASPEFFCFSTCRKAASHLGRLSSFF